jgi:hypothetical protein
MKIERYAKKLTMRRWFLNLLLQFLNDIFDCLALLAQLFQLLFHFHVLRVEIQFLWVTTVPPKFPEEGWTNLRVTRLAVNLVKKPIANPTCQTNSGECGKVVSKVLAW